MDASSADQVTVRYVSGSQDVVVNRSGGSPTSSFGGLDTIELESWHNGQNIALLDTTNDALMKLPGYPEPDPFSFTWQLGAGAPLLGIAIFLFFWRHALLQRMET